MEYLFNFEALGQKPCQNYQKSPDPISSKFSNSVLIKIKNALEIILKHITSMSPIAKNSPFAIKMKSLDLTI